jgi:hypothetical protein
MGPLERRVSDLLHEHTPQPPALLTVDDVLDPHPATDRRARVHTVAAAALAAAVVLAIAVAGMILTLGHRPSNQSPESGNTPRPSSSAVPASACAAADLALGYGERLSGATGEHGVRYVLTNMSAHTCTLTGYPIVHLLDRHGRELPFRYVHASQYVTSKTPRTVHLAPGHSAYLLVAKYRCDVGDRDAVTTIRIDLPNPSSGSLAGRSSPDGSGISTMTYCTGGTDDPGQLVSVSPFASSPGATSAR